VIEPGIPEFDETLPKLTHVLEDFSKLVPEAEVTKFCMDKSKDQKTRRR
jgi:hypothetical protein